MVVTKEKCIEKKITKTWIYSFFFGKKLIYSKEKEWSHPRIKAQKKQKRPIKKTSETPRKKANNTTKTVKK